MDKRTALGTALIVLIILVMPYYMQWISGEQMSPPVVMTDSLAVNDSIPTQMEEILLEPEPVPALDSTWSSAVNDTFPAVEETVITIESNRVQGLLSTANGGNLVDWQLLEYESYLGGPVDLSSNGNGIDVEWTDTDGKQKRLLDYNVYTNVSNNHRIILSEDNPSAEVEMFLPVDRGRIVKTFVFYYDRYDFDVRIRLENLDREIANRYYYVGWAKGLRATEENQTDDYTYSRAVAKMAGEEESLEITDEVSESSPVYTGTVDWAAIRIKYFVAAIIPQNKEAVNSVRMSGIGIPDNEIIAREYSNSLEIPFNKTTLQTDSFRVYLGPLDYNILKQYEVGLDDLVLNNGWYESLFRWIGLLMLPALSALYQLIGNYGWVIIIFAGLVKLLLHPLTKRSYQSMSEMQLIQPKMTELREKYKSDPQRQQREMMKLYKEHGINPLGGCLPTILQMPLLFALFIVFRSTIQLRGEPFIAWITDLSSPDHLAIPFTLPFIGDSISILPLLMGLTMVWQSKMTMTDPKQKAMIYFMPIFLIFIFYSLPSGLNLYYAVFNVLSMIQTRGIKKRLEEKGLDAKPAKETKEKKPAARASAQQGNRAQRRQTGGKKK